MVHQHSAISKPLHCSKQGAASAPILAACLAPSLPHLWPRSSAFLTCEYFRLPLPCGHHHDGATRYSTFDQPWPSALAASLRLPATPHLLAGCVGVVAAQSPAAPAAPANPFST